MVGGGALIMVSGGVVALGKPLDGRLYIGDKSEDNIYTRLSRDNCPSGEEFKLESVNNCVLDSNNGKSVLVVGDSQAGHLTPLLDMLNKVDGFGIYFYQSSGTNFPSLTESRNTGDKSPSDFRKHYKKTQDHFEYYFSKLNEGDIIILSSRYELRWGERPIPNQQKDLRFTYYDSNNRVLTQEDSFTQWKALFSDLAEKSADKDVKVIIFNSIPTFPDTIANQGTQWFNSLNTHTGVSRKRLIEHSRKVHRAFNDLAKSDSNVEVFDIFSEICPESNEVCTPEKYRDQWHLSASGSLSLREGLLKKLK